MPVDFLNIEKKGFAKLIAGCICILMISVLFHPTSLIEDTKNTEVFQTGVSDTSESETRYGHRIVEDFNNLTNIDSSNTTASVRTMDGRVLLWGSSPVIPPTYNGRMNQNTHSHGGGFSPKYNEYWYPQWSSTTVHRYDMNHRSLGSFNSGERDMMQLWGDKDGTYYTANWGRSYIYKWQDRSNSQIWSYNMGGTAGGVCCDDNYVYAMRYYQNTVYVLRKDNGQLVRSFNINGGSPRLYGSLAYANGLLYVGGYNNNYQNVGIFNPSNGAFVGQFNVQTNIYNMAFNGEEYCIDDTQNNPHRYKISDGNAYLGDEVEPPTNITYIQSKVLHDTTQTIGAVKVTWFEHLPQGTEIIYKITADGTNWITVENGTSHILKHRGSPLRWKATIKTDDKNISPYIEKIIIEYDLFSNPQPFLPDSEVWQGTQTPKLVWNFTDPDRNDHQSEYYVEIYDDQELSNQLYNSTWVNSTFSEHTIAEPLEDGIYYWRARTKDGYHVSSNYSVVKSFMIDITQPVGNITIQEDAISVNEKLVNLAIYAFDNGSGVTEMQIIGDRGYEAPWEDYMTEKRFALTPLDGLKKISVRFRDNAGIVSEIYNDTIYFDLKGPFDIEITSPTHPDPLVYYNSTLPVFSWEPPYEVTGIKGYSYTVDSTPLTEPTKVLYSQNNDITGTYAGEFAGLGEGTWYFHIAPCDIYDQWGNTTHFRFNIDSVAPVISELSPSENEWYRSTDIRAEATFTDAEGFGLDIDSIAYSYRKSGEGSFSEWTDEGIEFDILEEGIDDNPERVHAWVELDLEEGARNAVIWRITDISGNGPFESDRHSIKVDLTPVTFSGPLPADGEISTDTMVSTGITISDNGGSGVDGKTVEYSISKYGGDDEKFFINWTAVNNNIVKETLGILLDIPFEAGKYNYIRWRAKDAVGNSYAMSDAVRVWVNSAPVPAIAIPFDDEEFEEGATVRLNATGTEDNEDDELSYYWEIKGKTSKKVIFRAWGPDGKTEIEQKGKYLVYLYVDDGHGFNESIKLTIEIVPKPTGNEATKRWEDTMDGDGDSLPDWWEKLKGMDPDNPNDATLAQKDLYRSELAEYKGKTAVEDDLLTRYWWIFVIVGILILAMIIVMVAVTVKKKRKEEEVEKVENVPQQRYSPESYPIGSRDFHYPQYSEMYASIQSQPAYLPSYGTSSGWGDKNGMQSGMGYPAEQVQPVSSLAPVQERPALPMYTESNEEPQSFMDMSLPPLDLTMISIESEEQDEAASPSYTLPARTAEQGTPNLELKALPPATADEADPTGQVNDTGIDVTEAETQDTPDQSILEEPIAISPSQDIPSTSGENAQSPEADAAQHSSQTPESDILAQSETSPTSGQEESESNPLEDIFSSLPSIDNAEHVQGEAASDVDSQEQAAADTTSASPEADISEFPSVQCHACDSMNQVMTAERPVTITCASCGEQGYLAE